MKKSQLVIIIIVFLATSLCLSACVVTATPTPAPTAELPAPTATATEAPQYQPGTVVLDPEYSFDGQIEIIEENQEAFYNNFLDSLIRINRDYFKALKTSQGAEVTDVASLRIYLEENDWIIPAGLQIPIMSPSLGLLYASLSEPLAKSVSLKNIDILFVQSTNYATALQKGDINANYLFTAYGDVDKGYSIGIGFGVNDIDNANTISLIVAQKTNTNGIGFPKEGEVISGVETLNYYLRFILYVMRTMQSEPASELEEIQVSSGNYGDYYYLCDVDPVTKVGTVRGLSRFYSTFKFKVPSDSAPEIIKLN